MRDVIPYIFWPWFGISCFILLRRRVSHGSWRAMAPQEPPAPIEFPPPPPLPEASTLPEVSDLPEASTLARPDTEPHGAAEHRDHAGGDEEATPTPEPTPTPVAVMDHIDPDRPRSRTLAEAVEGIAMPCDLAPLMGTGPLDPRDVCFFTHGHEPGAVGSALSDEFERLGYTITPLDDRSILAERGPDAVEARLVSTELTSAEVMHELHPSAPEGALVVELKLT